MALVEYGSSDDDIEEVEDVEETKSQVVEEHNLFAELPAPKSSDDLLAEPEMIVEPSEKELSLREKPPAQPAAPKKTKKLIQLPSLPLDDSDEDEDEKPKPFIPSSSKGSLDLFGSLPKPKYCSKKELGRSLLPHILTKQKEPQKTLHQTVSSKVVQKPSASANVGAIENSKKTVSHGLLAADYVSDDEDDNDGSDVTNFFSLCSSSTGSRNVAPAHVAITLAPSIDSHSETENLLPEKPREETKQVTEGYAGTYTSTADAPLDFQQGQSSDEPLQFRHSAPNKKPVVGIPVGSLNPVPAHADYTDHGQDVTWQTYQTTENEFMQNPEYSANQEVKDQFQVPFGRKRKRGQEEIKVIEVNLADHLTGASLEQTKNLTIQKDLKSHSKKRNKDMPTSQQKRKHQITFLAHQAKERELELKNQWAENKFSKKQTQSKYGF